MSQWIVMEYITESGAKPFTDWLSGIPIEAKAFINNRLIVMEGMKKWPEKWVSIYHTKSTLFEFRFTFNKVAYRPLFVYSPFARSQLIILDGAIEKGGKIPKSTISTVLERAKKIESDPRRVIRHTY